MKTEEILTVLSSNEEKIRDGKSQEVSKILENLLNKKHNFDDKTKIKISNQLRRCGAFLNASKLLFSITQDCRQSEIRELALIEYAASLIFLGLTTEAQELFVKINSNKHPQVLTLLSSIASSQWDYESSASHLEKYLKSSEKDSYKLLVAQVNLLISTAFYAPEKLQENLILELKKEIEKGNFKLLRSVWTQIYGRYFLHQKKYEKAIQIFQDGLKGLNDSNSFDTLYLRKWLCVAEIEQEKEKKKEIKNLTMSLFNSLAPRARILGDFETLRECDYFISKYTKNKFLHSFCFLGSPFHSYRKKFNTRLLNSKINIPLDKTYRYLSNHNSEITFFNDSSSKKIKTNSTNFIMTDFFRFKIVSPKENTINTLTENSVLGLLFKSFFNDFYRPLTIPRIFKNIFKHNPWNPYSSPNQIRQLIFRLRIWLKENDIPFIVAEKNSQYFLFPIKEKVNIRLNIPKINKAEHEDTSFVLLKKNFGNKKFTFNDFLNFTKLPKRSAQRHLATLIKEQKIKTSGTLRRRLYSLITY